MFNPHNLSEPRKIILLKRYKIISYTSITIFIVSLVFFLIGSNFDFFWNNSYVFPTVFLSGLFSLIFMADFVSRIRQIKNPPKPPGEIERERREKIRNRLMAEEKNREAPPKYRISVIKGKWIVLPILLLLVSIAVGIYLLYTIESLDISAVLVVGIIIVLGLPAYNLIIADEHNDRLALRREIFQQISDPLAPEYEDGYVYTDSLTKGLLYQGGKIIAYLISLGGIILGILWGFNALNSISYIGILTFVAIIIGFAIYKIKKDIEIIKDKLLENNKHEENEYNLDDEE